MVWLMGGESSPETGMGGRRARARGGQAEWDGSSGIAGNGGGDRACTTGRRTVGGGVFFLRFAASEDETYCTADPAGGRRKTFASCQCHWWVGQRSEHQVSSYLGDGHMNKCSARTRRWVHADIFSRSAQEQGRRIGGSIRWPGIDTPYDPGCPKLAGGRQREGMSMSAELLNSFDRHKMDNRQDGAGGRSSAQAIGYSERARHGNYTDRSSGKGSSTPVKMNTGGFEEESASQGGGQQPKGFGELLGISSTAAGVRQLVTC
ncbi:hypothetical protein B0H14DRAFT_2591884 [Mycena olivaceomarginata]|nr:hypothetical protein B0H14DRAFT_2591884 [Mycena olivaceomarginata]